MLQIGMEERAFTIGQLARANYERALSVDIRDVPTPDYPMEPEVRKLKFLLESMV